MSIGGVGATPMRRRCGRPTLRPPPDSLAKLQPTRDRHSRSSSVQPNRSAYPEPFALALLQTRTILDIGCHTDLIRPALREARASMNGLRTASNAPVGHRDDWRGRLSCGGVRGMGLGQPIWSSQGAAAISRWKWTVMESSVVALVVASQSNLAAGGGCR
jgi:hypothetical protein